MTRYPDMADNYLERKMEDLRSGRAAAETRAELNRVPGQASRRLEELQATVKYNGRPKCGDQQRTEAELAVYDFLDRLGIDYVTLVHPAAATMEDCEAVRRAIGAPVFKNLFLTNKQNTLFFLLMIPADKPFKTKYLSSQLGCARLSFATPEHMARFLHISPGAVSPMGLIHDTGLQVRLIVDRDLEAIRSYACHPCVNTASVALSLDDLLQKVVPTTGHDFTWVDLPREPQD